MFNRSLQQRSSNRYYSLHTQRVFIQDLLNFFWISAASSALPFISHGKLLKDNVFVFVKSLLVICLSVFLYCSLLLPVYSLITFFILMLMLLVYFFIPFSFFYSNVVAIFLFIHWSSKQDYCFCFWRFCLSF